MKWWSDEVMIFDILELPAFRKYSICWVFYALCLCLCLCICIRHHHMIVDVVLFKILYEGFGMILGWFIRLQRWFIFFLRTDGRTNEGVPRGPRGPKKLSQSQFMQQPKNDAKPWKHIMHKYYEQISFSAYLESSLPAALVSSPSTRSGTYNQDWNLLSK